MPITEGGTWSPDNNLVSPGVFTRETEQPGLAQGVTDIGAVIVAPFPKGPGFSPTLVRDMATLQSQFGVPDGKLYGPYTAQQYLQEKGFVTVCRVGALTGYHQNYPLVIWAESGTWLRAPDGGWLNATKSFVSTTNLTFVTKSAVMISAGTASYSGSITFANQPATFVLMNGAITGDPSGANTGSLINRQAYPSSGSMNYSGQTVTGYISGVFAFSGSLNISTASATAANLVNQLIAQNLLTGSIKQVQFTGSTAPFTTGNIWFNDNATANQLEVSQSLNSCQQVTLNLGGFLTGSIGAYNGNFLAGTGNTFDPCSGTWTTGSSVYKVLAVLADTQNASVDTNLNAPGFNGSTQTSNPAISGSTSVLPEFDLTLSASNNGGYGVYHFSLDANSPKYITNVFGTDPTAGDPATYVQGTKIEAAYLYRVFEDDISVISTNASQWKIHGDVMPSGSWTGEALNFTDQWSLNVRNGDSAFSLTNATTPWVISQKIASWNGGKATRFPLFQLATIADGTNTNTSYKIEISNVKLAGTVAGSDWGTFTLSVRSYSDTDKKPNILESFPNLSLDPTSANFVARRIGDRYNYIRNDGKIIEYGTYNNQSKYIRVVMSPNTYPTTAVPYGFQAYSTPVNGAMGTWCNPVAYTKASIYSLFPGKYASGVDFGGVPAGADTELTSLYPSSSTGGEHWRDNLQYNAPLPAGAGIGSNTEFALDNVILDNGISTGSFLNASLSGSIPATYDVANETTYVKMRKFVFGFQGGFDGQSPAIPLNVGADIEPGNTQGLDCTNSNSAGSVAYAQCIGALGNADEFDMNLIVTPGILYEQHPYVTNLVVETCENRGDCFYILDLYKDDGNPSAGQISDVVSLAAEFDTNYAGAYYPWVKIKDTNTNQIITVPPSVVLPAVYAASDRVGAEWYAVAGLNRGGITQAVQVTDRTTNPERDTLYEGKVNPICTFPGQGIVVWGQKTLQNQDSALNRINVRRLLIAVKKFFASVGKYMVFEQNTAANRNKFLAIVNPYLEMVQQRSGLYAFEVRMDESNNTPDLIDQNILYGKILLQPTKTAEKILLDFNILPTGAAFPTA